MQVYTLRNIPICWPCALDKVQLYVVYGSSFRDIRGSCDLEHAKPSWTLSHQTAYNLPRKASNNCDFLAALIPDDSNLN